MQFAIDVTNVFSSIKRQLLKAGTISNAGGVSKHKQTNKQGNKNASSAAVQVVQLRALKLLNLRQCNFLLKILF